MARPKKRREPEYTLNIFRGTDPKTQQAGWIFMVRTIKEFVSFSYEILLSAAVEERVITIQISGIHAPLMVMPGVGPAKGVVLVKDILGSYTLIVRKLNKELNTFTIIVGPESVHLRDQPPQPFITVATDPLPVD